MALYGYDSLPFLSPSGVPQGSNLGPLLFLLYINDLLESISCNALAYADDVKIFHRIQSFNDCLRLQRDLDVIDQWCYNNRMTLNASKCKVISITKNKKAIKFNYKIQGVLLERVMVVRDLGVIFDSKLSFRPHYDYIVSKASKTLSFVLRTSKPFKRVESYITLYNALVRSTLEYCSSVWFPIYSCHSDRIEAIQRRFLRILCARFGLRRKLLGYGERLTRFKLKKLENRRIISDLCYLYKIANGQLGSELLMKLNFKVPTRSSRTPRLFSIPLTKNNVSQNSPIHRMARLYNKQAAGIDIFLSSLATFKNKINLFL